MEKKWSPYMILTTILSILFIIIIIYVSFTLIYPLQPINYIKKKYNLGPKIEEIENDATSIEVFTSKTKFKGKLYKIEKPENPTDTIILDLPGGGFLTSSNTLVVYKRLNIPYNVISIEYPVLPKGTYPKTIDYLHEVITYITTILYNQPKIILCGCSAGSFYCVKIINNGKFNNLITKFISTSGYFGYKTIENIITLIGDKIYLRKLNKSLYYDCQPIMPVIKTFYAVGDIDSLKISTIRFLELSGETANIMTYPKSDHCFYLRYNEPITQQYYADLELFIKN